MSHKQELNQRRQEFLLTLFPDKKEEYCALPMNGYVLVRQWNGNSKRWEVAIFTEESFSNSRTYLNTSLFKEGAT
jgi:hypothetical protein